MKRNSLWVAALLICMGILSQTSALAQDPACVETFVDFQHQGHGTFLTTVGGIDFGDDNFAVHSNEVQNFWLACDPLAKVVWMPCNPGEFCTTDYDLMREFSFIDGACILKSITVSSHDLPGIMTLTSIDASGQVVETISAPVDALTCDTVQTGFTLPAASIKISFTAGSNLAIVDLTYCCPEDVCQLEVEAGCVILPFSDRLDCQGKVIRMTLEYTGEGCDASNNPQEGKAQCSGDANFAPFVDILSSNNKVDKIWADVTGVALGGTFVVDAANAGRSQLDADTKVFISVGQGVIEELKIHTSCSKPISVGDQFGSLRVIEMTTTESGTTTLADLIPPEPESVCVITPLPPPHCTDKVSVLSLAYLGSDCSSSANTQGDKFKCEDFAGAPSEFVRIVAFNGGKNSGDRVWLDTGIPASVMIGDIVELEAANAGRNKLDSRSIIQVYDDAGDLIREMEIHTSCSQPLNLGDVFGGLEVVGIIGENGVVASNGANVEFSYAITNTGDTEVFNITVVDLFGPVPGSPIASLAPGETVVLTDTLFVTEPLSNLVTVAGNSGSAHCEVVDVTVIEVQEPPPPLPSEAPCTTKVQSMLLMYTGPQIDGATVEIVADKFRGQPVIYPNIDLIPGVTILSMATENNWLIDATAHGQIELGAKTRIFINGVEEVIHTSCSAPFAASAPAPLDNPKGAPSPNWFVVEFEQK